MGGVRQVGGGDGGAEVVAMGGKQGRYSLLISMHRIDRGDLVSSSGSQLEITFIYLRYLGRLRLAVAGLQPDSRC